MPFSITFTTDEGDLDAAMVKVVDGHLQAAMNGIDIHLADLKTHGMAVSRIHSDGHESAIPVKVFRRWQELRRWNIEKGNV